MTSNDKFRIQLLNDKNYQTWQFTIKQILTYKKVIKYIKNEIETPDTEPEKENVTTEKALAMSVIATSMESNQLVLILDTEDPYKAWKLIKDHHTESTLQNKLHYQRKLTTFKMDKNNILNDLKEFQQIIHHLKLIDDDKREDEYIIHLLNALPAELNHLTTIIEYMDREWTLSDIISRIKNESRKLNNNKNLNINIKTCSYCNRKGHLEENCFKKKKNDKYCRYCKTKGHTIDQCYKKKRKDQQIDQHKNNNINKQEIIKEEFCLHVNDSDHKNIDSRIKWLIDSGCSAHMTSNKNILYNLRPYSGSITIANGKHINVSEIGTCNIKVNGVILKLKNVLYVPEIMENIISVKEIINEGHQVNFLKPNSNITLIGKKAILKINLTNENKQTYLLSKLSTHQNYVVNNNDTYKWHQRLGHVNNTTIKNMIQMKSAFNIPNKMNMEHLPECEICIKGKLKKSSYPKEVNYSSSKFGELLVMDTAGPINTEQQHKRYYLLIIDHFTRFTWIFTIERPKEIKYELKRFITKIENQFNTKIKNIRTDNGNEFNNEVMKEFCEEKGINHQKTSPYSPQSNGIAERYNRTIKNMIRYMLINANLPNIFWTYAAEYAVYILNRILSSKNTNRSAYELLYKRKPNLKYLKIFGCKTFYYNPQLNQQINTGTPNKLLNRAIEGIFIGFDMNRRCFKIYNPTSNSIVSSRTAKFNEEEFPGIKIQQVEEQLFNEIELSNEKINQDDEVYNPDLFSPMKTRSGKEISTNNINNEKLMKITNDIHEIPNNYSEAILGDESTEWKNAIKEELKALQENKTWIIVDKLPKMNIIKNRWVFNKKIKEDNTTRFKARLVAKGFTQVFGIDYFNTYAPVAKMDSIRMFLSISIQENLILNQYDVKTAYLNGTLKENLFMEIPEGIETSKNKCCKLIKSIYGLKQSGRVWNEEINNTLIEWNFQRCINEPCIYYKNEKGKITLILIYVDDIILGATNENEIKEIYRILNNKYKITNLGIVKNFLNLEIEQLKGEIHLSQTKYIQKLIQKFKIQDMKNYYSPTDQNTNLTIVNEKNPTLSCNKLYRNIIGSLMYLMIGTRPDIAYIVGILSRYAEYPTQMHLNASKRVLGYLKTTINYKIIFRMNNINEIITYCDADFAQDSATRKSISGSIHLHGVNLLSWKSKRQTSPALSTMEAEYVALSTAAQQTIWLNNLLMEILKGKVNTPKIYSDNQAAIKISNNFITTPRAKHIDVKYHFIRHLIEEQKIKLEYINTKMNIADVFTKSLPQQIFKNFLKYLFLDFSKDNGNITEQNDKYQENYQHHASKQGEIVRSAAVKPADYGSTRKKRELVQEILPICNRIMQ